ncbi:MAG: hypothetical protein EOP04_15775 [Proteobacteria bacterium]|nr:MAG: hypothetical protein EOP04_15775 [Pseudomonadota bacterium]
MLTSKNPFLTPQSILLTVFLSLASISCAEEPQTRKPPVELAFDGGMVGGKTTFEVKIDEKKEYLLGVAFSLDENAAKAAQVEKILGIPYLAGSGKWIEPGVPAKFNIQIHKQPNNEMVLDSLVDHPKTRPGYKSRTADIAVFPMDVGVYRVTLQYVQGSPALASIPASILFTKAHHGK